MKKFLSIAIALAVVVMLGVSILADREVFSFAEPSIATTAGESVQSSESQEQESEGIGSYVYFGPDFLCHITSQGTVACYGSDEDGIVSDVPDDDGFSSISGGDNYACAFDKSERSIHCCGSMTLTTELPEPTPEPTAEATVEPTAEATTEPTVAPTPPVPTLEPSPGPPTPDPTVDPTPTEEPTVVPTSQ